MSSLPKTPISIESEKALLGSLIIDSESWEKISNIITPADFYDTKNRDVFSEIYDLQINDQPLDILILEESLKSRDKLLKIG
ncbi:MAG: DnaB-like helicase N-terminal domain-containing protein, partial [Gammaproteobacteria bacterium]